MIDRRALLGATAALGFVPGAALAASGDLKPIRAAADAGADASVARIQEWIRHPGIAAENWQMEPSCAFTMDLLRDAGFQTVTRMPTDGQPGIFATLDAGAKRTMGIYFMYDVKQVVATEWSSPPFDAALVDKPGFGKVIVGRGAVNQKGPEGAFLGALHAFRAAGRKLPVNLVLVAEGEEEIGSPHFHQVVQAPEVLAALKRCEGVVIPSAWQAKSGAVDINLGAKGMIEVELIASGEAWGRGPKGDIHSSLRAVVDSPSFHLVAALQTLVGPDGNTPAIDGWFDNVRPLTARERQLIALNSKAGDDAERLSALGVRQWINGETGTTAAERLASQPTVNIEGLVAGYTGPGGKTVLPGRAVAKLDFRLVPDQTAKEAQAKLRAHLAKRGFGDIEVKVSGGYDPTETAETSRIIRAQQAVYARAGAQATLFPRLAGSWPGATFTAAPVSLPAGQFGLGHGSGAHAPNEYFVVESSNPKVQGLVGSSMGFVDFLYEMAAIA